ncbi:hypothetical protein PybrP1_006038 [[Pythium] brassicae (nom. inval.)]|nr:hypothetical protein PybrP1_006038 [[Pythium] brassicae (nom. inval.)]
MQRRDMTSVISLGERHFTFSRNLPRVSAAIDLGMKLTKDCCADRSLRPLTKFYGLRALERQHGTDLEWIERKWTNASMRDAVPLFRTDEPAPMNMAAEVAKVFTQSSLSRVFLSGRVPGSAPDEMQFECSASNLIGHLAGESFLSDIAMIFALHKVCLGVGWIFIMDSGGEEAGADTATDEAKRRQDDRGARQLGQRLLDDNVGARFWRTWGIAVSLPARNTVRPRQTNADVELVHPRMAQVVVDPQDFPGIVFACGVLFTMYTTPRQQNGVNCGVFSKLLVTANAHQRGALPSVPQDALGNVASVPRESTERAQRQEPRSGENGWEAQYVLFVLRLLGQQVANRFV